jgi:hypothetical protein
MFYIVMIQWLFNKPVAKKLCKGGRQLDSNCTRVTANRIQIVPEWSTVASKFLSILFMLYAIGGHTGTICMRLVASTVQSRQYFESTLPEQ